MKITIEFSDGNSAFEDNGRTEWKNIMAQILFNGFGQTEPGEFALRDSNGNTVGRVKIENE